MTYKKEHPVIVEWFDSCHITGYLDKSDNYKSHDVISCRTIGYLVKSDRKRVVLSHESFNTGEERFINVIPRCNITRVIKLKE